MEDNFKLPRFYRNIIKIISLALALLIIIWCGKTAYDIVFNPVKVHKIEIIPGKATAERAIEYSLNIWQATVDNLGNDIATVEISLAIAGIVIAFLVALGGFYLNQQIKTNKESIESTKQLLTQLDEKIGEVKKNIVELDADKELLRETLWDSINGISASVPHTQLFSKNPFYNQSLLSFYSLLIKWKYALTPEIEEEESDIEKFLLGCYEFSIGNPEKAIKQYMRIEDSMENQRKFHLYFYKGLACDEIKEYDRAIDLYQKEIALNTSFKSVALSNMGFTYLEMVINNNHDPAHLKIAEEWFTEARLINKSDPYPYFGLAICHHRSTTNDPTKVASLIKQGERLEELNEHYKENYTRHQFETMLKEIYDIKETQGV
ncbi:MAG: hypothetical protein K1X55_05875 [Chitinophagales bacterium]|nr:hypothetical protein [Chitinophagales bacterium]